MTNLFDSCLPMTRDPIYALAVLATVLGAFALSGCMSEETASRLLVEPERYLLYSCPEIATAPQANIARQHELEGLMTKAGSGPAARSQAAWRMPRNIINCAGRWSSFARPRPTRTAARPPVDLPPAQVCPAHVRPRADEIGAEDRNFLAPWNLLAWNPPRPWS
jgi:hypothetical protein